jgi:hypothetical protein
MMYLIIAEELWASPELDSGIKLPLLVLRADNGHQEDTRVLVGPIVYTLPNAENGHRPSDLRYSSARSLLSTEGDIYGVSRESPCIIGVLSAFDPTEDGLWLDRLYTAYHAERKDLIQHQQAMSRVLRNRMIHDLERGPDV